MKAEKCLFERLKALRLRFEDTEMVVVYERGPRIASFSRPDEENLLYWSPGEHGYEEWDLMGGHRVWACRQMADEVEETYRPDNSPCEVTVANDAVVVMTPVDPVLKIARGLRITSVGKGRGICVENIIENCGENLYGAGIWSITCSCPRPDTEYFAPVGDGSSWDTFSMVLFKTWGGHGQNTFSGQQFRVEEEMLCLKPQGVENKRMFQAQPGIISMLNPAEGTLFSKQTAWVPHAHYPQNCNAAIYVAPDNFMVEMEFMGGAQVIKPGRALRAHEVWRIDDAASFDGTATSLQALFP